jgi:hypothetical protein
MSVEMTAEEVSIMIRARQLLRPKLFDRSSPGLNGFQDNQKVCCLPEKSGRQQIRLLDGFNAFDAYEIIYRTSEAYLFCGHNNIDGVEVFFTQKTSGQIGFWVCCRNKFRT